MLQGWIRIAGGPQSANEIRVFETSRGAAAKGTLHDCMMVLRAGNRLFRMETYFLRLHYSKNNFFFSGDLLRALLA